MEQITATLAHAQQISNLYEQFFAYNANQLPEYYQEAVETGAYPKSVIENESEELIVALENDRVIGFLHISEDKTLPFPCIVTYRYAVIIDLFIIPDYRNQGIGVLLLDKAKEWARDRSLSYIELSVLKNNVDGVRFYERENFEEVSRVMRYKL